MLIVSPIGVEHRVLVESLGESGHAIVTGESTRGQLVQDSTSDEEASYLKHFHDANLCIFHFAVKSQKPLEP